MTAHKTEYELVRDKLLQKKFLTAEDEFFLGTGRDKKILSSIPEKDRGDIQCVVDITEIREMVKAKYSLVDVMKKYNITRDVVCKIAGIEPIRFAPMSLVGKVKEVHQPVRQFFRPTEQEVQEIISSYVDGMSTHEIAKARHTTQQAIRHLLKKNGVSMDKKRTRISRLCIGEKERIDLFHAKDYSNDRIARETGIDIEQIRRYVKRVYGK